MPFDPFKSIARLEAKSPHFARFVAIHFLNWLSPFNGHLGSRLDQWTDERCVIYLKRHRGICNHVKSIHAGALFTLGETCAGLVVIRNFPFARYRPLMSDVKVNYAKQARGDVTGDCVIPAEAIARMHEELRNEIVPFIDAVTTIRNSENEVVATVTTTWQVKRWDLVRKKTP